MKSVSFSIRRVNRLRRAAERARAVPADDVDLPQVESPSDGWSASALRATELLRVFDVLWLKPGFALHACEFRAGSNGNGIIWAVPADAPLVAPDDCSRVEDAWLQPPRPPKAVPLMQALEGDGSPWSYLSASILSREAAEFGAIWHGCVWSDQTILSKPPRQADGQEALDEARDRSALAQRHVGPNGARLARSGTAGRYGRKVLRLVCAQDLADATTGERAGPMRPARLDAR